MPSIRRLGLHLLLVVKAILDVLGGIAQEIQTLLLRVLPVAQTGVPSHVLLLFVASRNPQGVPLPSPSCLSQKSNANVS